MKGVLRPRFVVMMMYLCYLTAGVFLLFFPSTISTNLNSFQIVIWHGFLILGGITGFVGAWIKKHYVELAALPLVLSALLVYALLLMSLGISDFSETGGVRIGFGLVILAQFFGLCGRTWEVWSLIKVSEDIEKRMYGE